MCSSDRSKCYSCNVVQRKNNNHSNNRSGKSGKSCKGSPSHCLLKLDLNENTIRSSSSSSSGSSESSPRKRSSKNNNHHQQKNNLVCCEERISHSSFRHSSASSTSSSSTSSSCPLHHISSSSCSRRSQEEFSSVIPFDFHQIVSCFITCKLYLIKKSGIRQAELLTHVIVLFVSIGCFLNVLHGDFVHDDIPAICTNQDVLGGSSLLQVFQNDFWGKPMSDPDSHKSYRPLTILTFRY